MSNNNGTNQLHCDLETWQSYFANYVKARQATILSLQELMKLNKSLLNANITGIDETKDYVELHLQIEALLADLANMEAVNFDVDAYDEKGMLKNEYTLTEKQKRNMMLNNEPDKIEKGSIRK